MTRAKGEWCILRTGGPRTLRLASSLALAGFNAWTPTMTVTRRKGRARERVEVPAPIVPTFVFVRASTIADVVALHRALGAHDSPHPPCSIFSHGQQVPLIADASLAALRREEERHRLRERKKVRTVVEPGSRVCPTEGPWGGMTGIVESSTNKEARVRFGPTFIVSIASYLLVGDVVQSANKPEMGIAA